MQTIRNSIAAPMKYIKRSYFTNYLQSNLNYLKGTWKSIKELISLKELSDIVPSNIFVNDQSLIEPQEVASAFNKCFFNVSIDIQSFIRYSKNAFHGFLPPINIFFLFLKPTDEIDVDNTIMSFNPSKVNDTNSIPTKILTFSINDVSSKSTEFFNLSFSHSVFPLILKISKVITGYQKDLKLKCYNYKLIALLSNIDKLLESLMYNRLYNVLEMNSVT